MSYTTSANETFDMVALNVYGDCAYAYKLIAANPMYCHKLRFDGGEVLTVPELTDEDTATATLPPWKQGG